MEQRELPCILVVAHDTEERTILKAELELSGFLGSISAAGHPNEALRLAAHHNPALAIYHRPSDHADGVQACQMLGADYGVSVLVLGTEAEASQARAAASLAIPYAFQDFLDLVRPLVSKEFRDANSAALPPTQEEIEIKYKDLFDRASDILLLMDLDTHTIVDANDQAVAFYGYPYGDLIGMSLLHLVPREQHPGMLENTRWMAREKTVLQVAERTHIKRDGTRVQVSISAGLLEYGGQWVFQDIVRDETERKRLEEAERETERLQVLLQVAGGTAHEINQPLTLVLTGADVLLAMLPPDSPCRTQVENILAAGERISEIVEKMRSPRQYVTTSYVMGEKIVDFDAAAQNERPEE